MDDESDYDEMIDAGAYRPLCYVKVGQRDDGSWEWEAKHWEPVLFAHSGIGWTHHRGGIAATEDRARADARAFAENEGRQTT